MQNTAIFHGCKNDNFHLNIFDYFHIFAQNIDWHDLQLIEPSCEKTCLPRFPKVSQIRLLCD